MLQENTNYATRYFAALDDYSKRIEVSSGEGHQLEFDLAVAEFARLCRAASEGRGKIMFVGNGGSASIASHMAIDFFKNGEMKAMSFNDPMFLTCLGNDLGYENVFGFQIERHAEKEDVLVAISSSGKSQNILNSVKAARSVGSEVVTLSGFGADNPLRQQGDLNFYVPACEYGFVELLHCSICHCVLDNLMGVSPE